MHLRMRLLLGVSLPALFITAGCTPGKGRISYTDIPECPGFQITQPSFTITPTAGHQPLGGDNDVSWKDGAVASPQTFSVAQLMIGTERIAGIRVTPPSGATAFTAEVRLTLNYSSCGFPPGQVLEMATRPQSAGSWVETPSTQDTVRNVVEAVVSSFSDWAIAD